MICAIVLAAGRSRRMGVQKLLLPWGGPKQTVIGHIISALAGGGTDCVIAVVGTGSDAVAAEVARAGAVVVRNPDPEGDMLSSVRCGIRALPSGCQAVIVSLGDQPSLNSNLVRQMLDAFSAAGKGILVPVHDGKRGHPVLFSTHYCDEVLARHDRIGLRGLLAAHASDVFELPVSTPGVLTDVDCPEDYRRELDRSRKTQ